MRRSADEGDDADGGSSSGGGAGGSGGDADSSGGSGGSRGEVVDGIVEVFADNLVAELDRMMELVERYPFVSVDTEFPGVVVRPIGSFNPRQPGTFRYQTLKSNVDMLSLIQFAVSFSDQDNNKPDPHTFQFNLKFDLNRDMYSQDSIDLLIAAGIKFEALAVRGIPVDVLAEHLMVSGLVLNPDVYWISFHGGYDIGYLLRLLSAEDLPSSITDFFELVGTYFPNLVDIKYLMRSCESLEGGLQRIAEDMQIKRVGMAHQAGSDARLTADAYFAIRSRFFDGRIDPDKFNGVIYGLQ